MINLEKPTKSEDENSAGCSKWLLFDRRFINFGGDTKFDVRYLFKKN